MLYLKIWRWVMAIWLCRAGRYGQYEARFFEDNKIFYTFEEIDRPLSSFSDRRELQKYFLTVSPTTKENAAKIYATQGYVFCNEMQQGDWIITPSKTSPGLLHFAEISGEYLYDENADESYRHTRPVKWFAQMHRNQFEPDIQAALGALMTICKIKQEDRIKKAVFAAQKVPIGHMFISSETPVRDLEAESLEEISDFLIQNYKGHGLSYIIEAILKAKGFTVYRSPKGIDHGIDLLASSGCLGFDSPKICVQVKSTDEAIDRPVLDQLIGTMANVGADYGLLVSWSGFKSSIIREIPLQFFKVRLWSHIEILNELFQCYDLLDENIKQKIPLKRIWVLDNKNNNEK